MKILILPDKTAAVSSAARTLADKVRDQPTAILGLATGETMIPLYRAILEISVTEFLSFSKISKFQNHHFVNIRKFSEFASLHILQKIKMNQSSKISNDHTFHIFKIRFC